MRKENLLKKYGAEKIKEPLVVLDRGLCILTANPSFCKTFKCKLGNIERKSVFDLGKVWKDPKFGAMLNRVADNGLDAGHQIELDLKLPGGGKMLWTARKARKGKSEFILLAAADLDKTQGMREALRLSEEKFRCLFQHVHDFAMIMLDDKGNVIEWNAAAERMLGYKEKEVMGKRLDFIFTPEDQAAGMPQKELNHAHKYKRSEDERWHIRKDGVRFWASGSLSMIHDENENTQSLYRFIKIFRDKTDMKKTMEALERSNQELENFAYIASHDLQEPLRIIQGYADLIMHKAGDADEETKEYLHFIEDGARRAQHLTRELLNYAKVSTIPKIFKQIEFKRVMRRTLEILQVPVRESGASIIHGRLPVVLADSFLMVQLMQNLLANAIKYQRPGIPPKIRISAEKKKKEWLFSVRDNGIGIAPEHHGKIFEIFKRVHTQPAHTGSGIGLAICKKIVETHGGKIWVDSQAGKGSTFFFTLPR